jgi:hypothetical protein
VVLQRRCYPPGKKLAALQSTKDRNTADETRNKTYLGLPILALRLPILALPSSHLALVSS